MVLIEDGTQAGVSFWYPFGFRDGKGPVRVMYWEAYRRYLRLRVGLNVALLVFGLLLFDSRIYTDPLYEAFAALVLVSTVQKLWIFIPRGKITVTRTTSVKLLPLAGLDFAGTYLLLGIMLLVFADQTGPEHFGAQLWPLALVLVLFSSLPVITASNFLMRGRRPQR